MTEPLNSDPQSGDGASESLTQTSSQTLVSNTNVILHHRTGYHVAQTQTLVSPNLSNSRNSSNRAEVDTSHPFESVKEAVNLFGGSGLWRPTTTMNTLQSGHSFKEVDIAKVEEQASELEKYLIIKERETLEVLKELETTKRIVEELKVKLQKETSESVSTSQLASDNTKINSPGENEKRTQDNFIEAGNCSVGDLNLCPSSSPGLILLELKQAKVNLTKTTDDLAGIRASVESLHKKLEKERSSLNKTRERLTSNSAKISSLEEELNRTRHKLQLAKDTESKDGSKNPEDISKELQQLNSEAELFRKMAEATKSEISKAIFEIEGTKTSIKTTEIRWIAAKKMAEAARAVEALALAEFKALSNSESSSGVSTQNPEGVTISFEEYSSLVHKAREAEELSKKRVLDAMVQIDEATVSKMEILKKVEEASEEVKSSKMALEEALNRVEVASRGKLAVEEALRKWRSEHGQKRRSVYNSTKFKNSYPSVHRKDPKLLDVNGLNMISDGSKSVLRPTLSIGQILSRKLLMPEEFEVEMPTEDSIDKQKVSLGQMLGKPSGFISPPQKSEEGNSHKQFSAKRKKFGFGRFSHLLAKQSKKKKMKKKQAPTPRWSTCTGEVQDISHMKN